MSHQTSDVTSGRWDTTMDTIETMAEQKKFRMRLRVRIGNALTTDELIILAHVAGRDVEIRSQAKNGPLREAKWIVLSAGGFDSEDEAQTFGEKMRIIAGITGICTRIGIDVGENKTTSWIHEDYARAQGLIKAEERIHPSGHGLTVFPDDGLSRFFLTEETLTATTDPAPLLESLNELGENVALPTTSADAGIRVLNLALISSDPLTQVVLAISVIEEMGQNENWTRTQRDLLTRLALDVENAGDAGDEEKEVAEALRRSLHRVGLRAGVLRVLSGLSLGHLKKEWDRVYGLRSGVFHGTNRLNEPEMRELAQAATILCGKVLIALLRQEGISVPVES